MSVSTPRSDIAERIRKLCPCDLVFYAGPATSTVPDVQKDANIREFCMRAFKFLEDTNREMGRLGKFVVNIEVRRAGTEVEELVYDPGYFFGIPLHQSEGGSSN